MIAGADSISDMDLLRHGGMDRLFDQVRAPLTGVDKVVFVDLDDTVRKVYGSAKQGAGRGYTGVNGLSALLAILSTPRSAPVIAPTRLRKA